jgi:hypothetical protein
MRVRAHLFLLAVVLLLPAALIYVMPPALRPAWAIGWLVTLAVDGLYELKMARREQRALGLSWMTGWLLLLTWPLRLIFWLLMFYGMRAQPRWDAQHQRRQQERIARAIANDAARTNRRCASCGKPVPSYRRTCRHCHEPFSATVDSGPAAA